MKNVGYLSATAEVDAATGASRAVGLIRQGETVAVFAGDVMTRQQLDSLPDAVQRGSIQIDETLFLVDDSPARQALAHRCAPNCGLRGGTVVVAMRDILPGELLSIDQAMCDGSDVDDFECHCGVDQCRGKVTGNDWMLPELQLGYRGYFSPYLANRISSLVHADAGRRAFAY